MVHSIVTSSSHRRLKSPPLGSLVAGRLLDLFVRESEGIDQGGQDFVDVGQRLR